MASRNHMSYLSLVISLNSAATSSHKFARISEIIDTALLGVDSALTSFKQMKALLDDHMQNLTRRVRNVFFRSNFCSPVDYHVPLSLGCRWNRIRVVRNEEGQNLLPLCGRLRESS